MASKSTGARRGSSQGAPEWDVAAGEGDPWNGDDSGYEADVAPPRAATAAEREQEPEGRRLDSVTGVLAMLPPGDGGRTLKLALLDALAASARADRITLPLEMQGLRARVRAGTA